MHPIYCSFVNQVKSHRPAPLTAQHSASGRISPLSRPATTPCLCITQLRHCPDRNPPFRAVTRPTRPDAPRAQMQTRHTKSICYGKREGRLTAPGRSQAGAALPFRNPAGPSLPWSSGRHPPGPPRPFSTSALHEGCGGDGVMRYLARRRSSRLARPRRLGPEGRVELLAVGARGPLCGPALTR